MRHSPNPETDGPLSIRVIILDDTREEHCAQCGKVYSIGKLVDFAQENIRGRYGDTVELEYLDLAEPSVQERHPELVERVKAHPALPVVLIGGIVVLAGNIDYRILVEAIEAVKEVGFGQGL